MAPKTALIVRAQRLVAVKIIRRINRWNQGIVDVAF
jgi:hypothetical protein